MTKQSLKRRIVTTVSALCLLFLMIAPLPARAGSGLEESTQMLLSVSAGWSEPTAMMVLYERPDTASPWSPVFLSGVKGEQVYVMLGRNGLGWGLGEHGGALSQGPVKQEGDGKAPAGVFRLESAFGYGPEPIGIFLPYKQSTATDRCVDDVSSAHYNSLVDQNLVAKDWSSAEKMLRGDVLYKYGIVVAHNWDAPTPGAGSCIFLHVWRAEGKPTAGCTAMNESTMQEIMMRIDPARNPRLVQLPKSEYQRLRGEWGLP